MYLKSDFLAWGTSGTLNQRMAIFIEMLAANIHKTCGDSF